MLTACCCVFIEGLLVALAFNDKLCQLPRLIKPRNEIMREHCVAKKTTFYAQSIKRLRISKGNATSTGGPRNLRTFYLQICLFTFQNWKKWQFSSQKWTFAVQNDGTYLPRITRETCSEFWNTFMERNKQNRILKDRKYRGPPVITLKTQYYIAYHGFGQA